MTYNHGIWREQDSVKARTVLERDARREFEIALKRTPGRSLLLLDLARACGAAGA